MTGVASDRRVRAASLAELRAAGRQVVHLDGHVVCLFAEGEEVYAVDNRCPHMGFPLHRGTVCDGILTCHWHHARFDLATGGTFDQFADELRRFPVSLDGDDVLVDVRPPQDPAAHQRKRLRDGLERDIPLVVAKAAIALFEADPSGTDVFRSGLEFGVGRRGGGWFRGLTTLTCFMNLAPRLDAPERPAALYHGLADVAMDSAGDAPRFPLEPLPGRAPGPERLAAWFRRFVEVRDTEGAERALVSAVRGSATQQELADMLFAAATDHRYLDGGHTLDFVNKALEALDDAGWEHAESVLGSLPPQLAGAERMEESNAWRNPVDLVRLLEDAFAQLPPALEGGGEGRWAGRHALVATVLEGEAGAIADALLTSLRDGATEVELASAVTFAAATRIARFPTSNEFGDWDTALHTFTFANAVERAGAAPTGSRAGRRRRGVAHRAAGAARSAAAGRRGAAAGGVLPRLGRGASTARRGTRRGARARGPQLPHDPVCGSGRAATRPARRDCGRPASAHRRSGVPRGPRHDEQVAAADVRHRAPAPPRGAALRGGRLGPPTPAHANQPERLVATVEWIRER